MIRSLEVIYVAGPYSARNPWRPLMVPATGLRLWLERWTYKRRMAEAQAEEAAEIAANVAEAVAFGQKVRALGFVPMVPHVAILPTKDYEQAMAECFDLISRCDGMVLMPTWPNSPGARREVDFARKLELEIFDDLEILAEVARAIA